MAKNPVKKKWSMLAYIAGDNSLSDFALLDVQEMCNEGSSNDIHVGVQVDTAGEFDGLIRYEITPRDFSGVGHRTVIQRLPESDTGSPKCLSDFLKFGIKRYPSQNTIAVVWSHGSGFKTVRRDAGFDDTSGKSMDMNEITGALTKAGYSQKNKLTIIGFDACLMAMLEVAHHFKDHAEILVGSQQTEPGDGWPYHNVLRRLKGTKSKESFAKAIVEEYITHYTFNHESGVTQSAINIAATIPAVGALKRLGAHLASADKLDGIKTDINKIRIQSQNFEYADYIDAIDFGNKLTAIAKKKKRKELEEITNDFIKLCRACIIGNGTFGAGAKNANGISFWFPPSREVYIENRAKYKKLKCNVNGSGWIDFLDKYYSG